MNAEDRNKLRSKIEEGLRLAYERLLNNKQKEDGELVISHNGEIIRIKARDLQVNK